MQRGSFEVGVVGRSVFIMGILLLIRVCGDDKFPLITLISLSLAFCSFHKHLAAKDVLHDSSASFECFVAENTDISVCSRRSALHRGESLPDARSSGRLI